MSAEYSVDAAFDAWVATLPAKHWAKYDISACRLGWEAQKANRIEADEGAASADGWSCIRCGAFVDVCPKCANELNESPTHPPAQAAQVDACYHQCKRIHPHCQLRLTRDIWPDVNWHWGVTMPDGHLYDNSHGPMSFEQALADMQVRGVTALDAADIVWRNSHEPAAEPVAQTLADFVNATDAERVQIGQQVAERVDGMMAEPVALGEVVDDDVLSAIAMLEAMASPDGGSITKQGAAEIAATVRRLATQPHSPDAADGGRVDADSIALGAAHEIALMWGQDRSQFVAKIQVRVIAAIRAALAAQPQSAASPAGVLDGWADVYAAFKGAFDTPAAWLKDNSEYANDARKRLREFNEAMLAAAPSATPEGGEVGL